MQRRADEKQALLQGTVGRDARIRSYKQHDLTPKREDGSSSVSSRKNKRRTEDLAKAKIFSLSRVKRFFRFLSVRTQKGTAPYRAF